MAPHLPTLSAQLRELADSLDQVAEQLGPDLDAAPQADSSTSSASPASEPPVDSTPQDLPTVPAPGVGEDPTLPSVGGSDSPSSSPGSATEPPVELTPAPDEPSTASDVPSSSAPTPPAEGAVEIRANGQDLPSTTSPVSADQASGPMPMDPGPEPMPVTPVPGEPMPEEVPPSPSEQAVDSSSGPSPATEQPTSSSSPEQPALSDQSPTDQPSSDGSTPAPGEEETRDQRIARLRRELEDAVGGDVDPSGDTFGKSDQPAAEEQPSDGSDIEVHTDVDPVPPGGVNLATGQGGGSGGDPAAVGSGTADASGGSSEFNPDGF